MNRRNHRQAGFSLVEIVVALGLVAAMGAVSISWFVQMQRRTRLNSAASDVMGKIMEARTEALSGRLIGQASAVPASPGEFTGWAAQRRSTSAGFRIIDPTTFEVFIDNDSAAGGEQVIGRTDLDEENRNNQVSFDSASVGAFVRFTKDGTAIVSQSFTLMDQDLKQARQISVSKVGHVRIEPTQLP